MTSTPTLDVELRTIEGKKVKQLRSQGLLPAVVYGKGFEAVSVQIDNRTFLSVYKQVGRSQLIDLNIPGRGKQAAFVHVLQRHPVTRAILHADLRVVDLKVEMNVDVPVIVVGEPLIVTRGDAVLIHVTSSVQVHALPADIPQHIEVDASHLESIDQSIFIRDIAANTSYKVLGDPDTVLVALTPTRSASDVESDAALPAAPAEPELIRKPREDDEE
jgi:large subunit ribosomal protein L25